MTSSTGKRSFRACLRCRRRKTKCDLDGTGGRTESPCKSCRLSGDDCVLVRSRRGQWRNHTWRKSRASNANVPEASGDRNEVADPTNASSSTPQATILCATQSPKPRLASTTDHDRYLELKTPADALQILAQSNHQLSTDESSVARDSTPRLGIGRHAIGTGKLGLDGYELLKIGALSVSVIIELLQRYTTIYHPYCPLIPEYFLAVHAIEQITKIDHFLLTAVLTIASRDSPGHVLAHRYCWEHTQRLLLDVSLARTSTQTPRTVEGLLLLAEWLPHIETTLDTIEPATSLFGEDRLAWSLVGLAIRHGYLLHLDRGAFRDNTQATTEEDFRQNRLIWHFVYLADRHISVRLGQSFWSRGPSLSSYFTADDFPTLKPKPESTHDHSALLLANLELVQILYNAHLILYPSTQRTWTLIRDGDYARYLDDFLSTATSWHESWKHLETGLGVSSSVLMTYDYVCLYVNAFSFQAVLMRYSRNSRPVGLNNQSLKEKLFPRGTLSSPDGLYVNNAIHAATRLLKRITSSNYLREVQYLPSRFYLYAIYAAVFLYRAIEVGALKDEKQVNDTNAFISRLIARMRQASVTESHVCHIYSKMLESLQKRQNKQQEEPLYSSTHSPGASNAFINRISPPMMLTELITSVDGDANKTVDQSGQQGLYQDNYSLYSFDEFTFSSFWPGIGDFAQPMSADI